MKYITNRDLLAEIQNSKASYCYFTTPDYAHYDAVVTNTETLTPAFLSTTLNTKLTRLAKAQIVTTQPITTHDVVFRVMSDTHLPEETDEKRRKRSSSGGWVPKTNFPPFQHYVLHGDSLIEVGRSHWRDDLDTGEFCTSHGKMTNRLANMFLLLVDQYSRRGNWRGYCVDQKTEALTQRGWLGIDEINETDIVLSYDAGKLTWSKIKSIYRGDYDGKMFHLTGVGIDALVTPGHKFVTDTGLKSVEHLDERDTLILSGDPADVNIAHMIAGIFSKSIKMANIDFHGGKAHPNVPTIDYKGRVWCPETEYGSFMARRNGKVFLSGNSYVADMRGQALVQLTQVGLQFDESRSDNPFAWYTQIIKNVFRRILLLEKRNQDIRDDLLTMAGAMPSYTRQVEDEIEQRDKIEVAVTGPTMSNDPVVKELKRRGRKPKVQD